MARKLIVEVIDARNLLPKDRQGASNPYVTLNFQGQQRKTRTVFSDLNPWWNETLEFHLRKTSEVFNDILELNVVHNKNKGLTTRNDFLGRVRLNSKHFVKKGEEALIYYPLEKKNPLSRIQGEIGLKTYFTDVKPDNVDAPMSVEPPSASDSITDVAKAPPLLFNGDNADQVTASVASAVPSRNIFAKIAQKYWKKFSKIHMWMFILLTALFISMYLYRM